MLHLFKQRVASLETFFKHGLWCLDLTTLPPRKRWFYRALQILIFTNRQYTNKKCLLQASSLTLLTLFSIVPLFALAFGIANSFGLEDTLKEYINQSFGEHQQVLDYLLTFSQNLLQRTQGGIVAGVGLFVLLFTIMRLLYYIEQAFNEIWEIKRNRRPIRILTDYLSIMIIAPVLIVFSNDIFIIAIEYGVNFFSRTYITNALPFNFNPSVLSSARYLLFGLMLSLLYVIMPNTNIKTKYAIISGLITGVTYTIIEMNYISIQTSVSSYNQVYGSFAVFPLFLIWLQISWYIILYGAALTYGMDNTQKYRLKQTGTTLTQHQNIVLAISIMHFIVKNFDEKRGPTSVAAIVQHVKISKNTVRDILNTLTETKLLAVVANEDEEQLFLPYINTVDISIERIFKAFNPTDNSNQDLNIKRLLNDKTWEILEEADKLRTGLLNQHLVQNL